MPLPDRDPHLAGASLVESYPLVPLGPGQGLAIAISTRRGHAYIGLHADPTAVADLDNQAEHFRRALTELLY